VGIPGAQSGHSDEQSFGGHWTVKGKDHRPYSPSGRIQFPPPTHPENIENQNEAKTAAR